MLIILIRIATNTSINKSMITWSRRKLNIYILGLELYEEMLRSMIEKVDQGSLGSVIQCAVCKRSYKTSQTTNLKNHIEAKHIDNVRFTCCVCGGMFSSRASFRTHSRNFHKEIMSVPFDVAQIDQFWMLKIFSQAL